MVKVYFRPLPIAPWLVELNFEISLELFLKLSFGH
jgi:hypothetical protein